MSVGFPFSSPVITSLLSAVELDSPDKIAELISHLPENDPDYWFAKKIAGDCALKEGNLKQAEKFYQEALAHCAGIYFCALQRRVPHELHEN